MVIEQDYNYVEESRRCESFMIKMQMQKRRYTNGPVIEFHKKNNMFLHIDMINLKFVF